MSEIELILTKLKIVSEEKESGVYLCDKEHSKILLDYIQQKENIINEVREYLDIDESIRKNCKRYDVNGIGILEILDKEVN